MWDCNSHTIIALFQTEPAPKECVQNTDVLWGSDLSLLLIFLILILHK